MSNKTINDRHKVAIDDFESRLGFNDHAVEGLKYIKSIDNGFYRINKTYYAESTDVFGTITDAKVQDFRGGSSYNSFNQLQYTRFFQATEVMRKGEEGDTRWCKGYKERPLLQILCCVKYTLSKGPVIPFTFKTYDSLVCFQDLFVRKNKLFLPLGITYDSYITQNEFDKLSKNGKDNALIKCFIPDSIQPIDCKSFKEIHFKDISDSIVIESLQNDIQERKKDTLKISNFDDTHFTGTISLSSQKLLFLAIPNDEGWHAIVDGKKQSITTVSAGMMGILLKKGNHKIELVFIRPYFLLGIIVSICFLLIFIICVFYRTKIKHLIES